MNHELLQRSKRRLLYGFLILFALVVLWLAFEVHGLIVELKQDRWYRYRYIEGRSCRDLEDNQARAYCSNWLRHALFGYPEV